MKASLIIRQDLTFKEVLSSTFYLFLFSKRVKIFLLFILALSLLSSFLGFATTPGQFRFLEVFKIILSIILFLFVMCLLLFVVALFLYKTRPNLFKNIQYEFTLQGIQWQNENGRFSKPWDQVTKMKETSSFFMIYINRINFHVIQKRMFKDEYEISGFRNCLKETINK